MATVSQRFTTGEAINMYELPDESPPGSSVGTYITDYGEVPVSVGPRIASDFHMSNARATETETIELRDGAELTYGLMPGVKAPTGYAWWTTYSGYYLYGNSPLNMPVEQTVDLLANLGPDYMEGYGVSFNPTGRYVVSPYRSPHLFQQVPEICLMDVRLAQGRQPPRQGGESVEGGRLYRSPAERNDYLILDDGHHLTYFYAWPGRNIQDVTDFAASVKVEPA